MILVLERNGLSVDQDSRKKSWFPVPGRDRDLGVVIPKGFGTLDCRRGS